jgi:copper chaperone
MHVTTGKHRMIAFEIQDMRCGHCVAAVTRAVQAVDAAAVVEVDLAARRVCIESGGPDPQRFRDAIAAAGHAARPVTLPPPPPAAGSAGA